MKNLQGSLLIILLLVSLSAWAQETAPAPGIDAEEILGDLTAPLIAPSQSIVSVVSSVETKSSRLLAEMLEGAQSVSVTSATVADVVATLQLASLARQESIHVERSVDLSYLVPGLGHYVNGERRTALGYLITELAVDAVTLSMMYWFLPPAVQWRNLNYLASSFTTIRDRWQALTPSELLPALSFGLSGALVSAVIRYQSGRDAARAAVAAIESDAISFTPKPIILIND